MNAIDVDITTGDKLCYLLALTTKPWHVKEIYPAMFQLKDRFPQEWAELNFFYSSGQIHSRELERYFSGLQALGIGERQQNSSYALTDNAMAHELKNFQELSAEAQERIKRMALTLDEILEG